jgi:polyisoprenoid-binding protein YceI
MSDHLSAEVRGLAREFLGEKDPPLGLTPPDPARILTEIRGVLMLRRTVLVALLPVLLLTTTARAQETTWRIDTNHSAAHFSVRHMMISTVRGDFGGIKGTVTFDPANPTAAKVDATIDATTINTGAPPRDRELKGPDFFEIAKYPTMRFTSSKVEPNGPGNLKVYGDLTINATTKPVLLTVEGPSEVVKDAQGRLKRGLSGTTKINRKEFGIVWNETLDSGGFAVADEVTISLDIELIKT